MPTHRRTPSTEPLVDDLRQGAGQEHRQHNATQNGARAPPPAEHVAVEMEGLEPDGEVRRETAVPRSVSFGYHESPPRPSATRDAALDSSTTFERHVKIVCAACCLVTVIAIVLLAVLVPKARRL